MLHIVRCHPNKDPPYVTFTTSILTEDNKTGQKEVNQVREREGDVTLAQRAKISPLLDNLANRKRVIHLVIENKHPAFQSGRQCEKSIICMKVLITSLDY